MRQLFLILTVSLTLTVISVCGQDLNRCSKYLLANYYTSSFDTNLIREAVPLKDSSIIINYQYQSITNPEKDRFVSFFVAERISKTKRDIELDKMSNLFSGQVPKYDGYIVSGIKFKEKWYYAKEMLTSFSEANIDSARKFFFCNSLLNLKFINCLSRKVNKDFWNSNSFRELKNQKHWSISDLEIYTPYIGLPTIVANSLIDSFIINKKQNELSLYNSFVLPHINRLKEQNKYEYISAKQMSKDFVFIHSMNDNIIIYPLTFKVKDSDYYIKFFVLQKTNNFYETYEWNYLKPSYFKIINYGSPLFNLINSLTYWTYTMPYISNSNFWTTYVIRETDGNFIYLTKLD